MAGFLGKPLARPYLGWLWNPAVELQEAGAIPIAQQATMIPRGLGFWECLTCGSRVHPGGSIFEALAQASPCIPCDLWLTGMVNILHGR